MVYLMFLQPQLGSPGPCSERRKHRFFHAVMLFLTHRCASLEPQWEIHDAVLKSPAPSTAPLLERAGLVHPAMEPLATASVGRDFGSEHGLAAPASCKML